MIIKKIKKYLKLKEVMKVACNKGSFYVSWTQHDPTETKEFKYIEEPREFIDRITAETFKYGIVANEELKKAYSIFMTSPHCLGINEIDWNDFIKDIEVRESVNHS